MNPLNRRALFGHGLGLAAGLAFAGRARAIDPIVRATPSHLKLSVAAYSYRQALTAKPPKLDLFGFVDLAAEMGLDAVELTSYYFPPDADAAYLAKLRRHAFLRGLDVSGTAIGNDFCLPAGPKRDATFQLTKTWIDNAVELGAPVIRIFAGATPKGDTEDAAVDRAIEGIREALAYAEPRGIVLALENHGGVTTRAEQLLRIVKAVNSPSFGVNLDTGNFKGEDPYAELEALAPYAVNVQVKTEINPGNKGKHPADLARMVKLLRDAKYSGYVVLEYEAAEDPFVAVPRYIKELRSLIS